MKLLKLIAPAGLKGKMGDIAVELRYGDMPENLAAIVKSVGEKAAKDFVCVAWVNSELSDGYFLRARFEEVKNNKLDRN